jgi:alkanesulfonate monooxygenase SsuD/methylene tetrahydromethanopterin reductase-like flavin-dependent oxidoreductase (luciferase family)
MPTVKLGALCWNQYADWPSMLEAGRRADQLGYDSLWTWDHVYPIVGDWRGPIYEGWLAITAWAMATERVQLGLMVGANTFREPALTAKMATTLDHISGGRAVLGIGAAWYEREHRAFGFSYGSGAPERLRWLRDALPIMRGMLRGETPSAPDGSRYTTREVRNDPLPLQPRMPLLIGGGGERVTLRLVAEYADMHDVGGRIETVMHKDDVLRAWCERVGRDFDAIERLHGIGTPVIRNTRREAEEVRDALFEYNGGARPWTDAPIGTPEDVAEQVAPFVEIGRRHLVAGFLSPYDEESMVRLVTEVKPLLER